MKSHHITEFSTLIADMPISNEKVEEALVLVGFSSHSGAPSSLSVASPLPSVTAVAVIDQFTSPAAVLFWGTNQDLAGPTQYPSLGREV